MRRIASFELLAACVLSPVLVVCVWPSVCQTQLRQNEDHLCIAGERFERRAPLPGILYHVDASGLRSVIHKIVYRLLVPIIDTDSLPSQTGIAIYIMFLLSALCCEFHVSNLLIQFIEC